MSRRKAFLSRQFPESTLRALSIINEILGTKITTNERDLIRAKYNYPDASFAAIGRRLGMSKQGCEQLAKTTVQKFPWSFYIIMGDTVLSDAAFGGMLAPEPLGENEWVIVDSYRDPETARPKHYLLRVLPKDIETQIIVGPYDIVDDEIVLMPGAEMREVA